MPRMRGGPAGARRGGRRGRRTSQMIRTAHERIGTLFSLAELEARRGPGPLPSRYVQLARRIGMRYNVRIAAELREFYCRDCSTYWVEGRTVRTRLRGDRRVRTCLACGATRRTRIAPHPSFEPIEDPSLRPRGSPGEPVLVGEDEEMPDAGEGEDE